MHSYTLIETIYILDDNHSNVISCIRSYYAHLESKEKLMKINENDLTTCEDDNETSIGSDLMSGCIIVKHVGIYFWTSNNLHFSSKLAENIFYQ